jgi:tellurite resistance protein TerC
VPIPISHWIGFHVGLIALLAIELGYVRRQMAVQARGGRDTQFRTAIAATALWIGAALGFALYLSYSMGPASSIQYLAGYTLEESLSIDNLFVFLLLFRLFRIDRAHQPKVLFWGVAGAMVLRGLFIAGGVTLLARFAWTTYVFAAVLLIAAVRLLVPSEAEEPATAPGWLKWLTRLHPVCERQDTFVVMENGRPMATILLLALIAVELSDIVFALDSIPAVLSITRQPFLAYTSNIMAVMGLRSLYFLLIGMLTRLRFLHYGLAAVLGFAALKMLAARWVAIGPVESLSVILGVLGVTICASIWAPGAAG